MSVDTVSGGDPNANTFTISDDVVDPRRERFQGKSRAASKDLLKICTWAKENYSSIKMGRSMTERNWYLNMSFYFGKQHVIFRQLPNFVVGPSGNLFVPPAPYWRSRPVINRIRPTIRREQAKLTAQRPSAYVIPASSDDRDLFAAQAAEQIWESMYREKKLKAIIRRWVWWGLICGSSFMKTYWDEGAIDVTSNQMGDICYSHETPFNIFCPDFREEDLEGQPFLIHATLKTRDWVQMYYPQAKIDSKNQQDELLNDSWLNIIGAQNIKNQKSVLVLEVWVKPGAVPLFPEGAMFTIVGDSIVDGMETWPFEHGLFPFAKFDHIPSGKFYADSSIVDLLPLQREYNRTRGQLIEAKNRMAKPQLAAEKGSIDPSKITTEPGQVILYQPGYNPPTPIPLTPMPNYVLQELERIHQDWNDISGQHEVSQGQTPPGVTAATAINYLQEQDDSLIHPSYESLEEGIEKVAFMTLSYVHQFWDTQRTVRITGADQSFDVMAFKGSDLRGNTDIRVEGGSSLPTSKAAKQAFIMDLMKMGFIDPNKGLEIMEIGGVDKLYEEIQVDVRQAQRENLRMAQVNDEMLEEMQNANVQKAMMGENPAPPDSVAAMPTPEDEADPEAMNTEMIIPSPEELVVPVNSFDNHPLHIEYHNKYRKSQAYEALPESAKLVFEMHVQQHQRAAAEQAMGQMQTGITPDGTIATPDMMPQVSMPPVPPTSEGSTSDGSNTGSGETAP